MNYEFTDIQQSQQLFYYLLAHHALAEQEEPMLFRAYTENEQVKQLVKSQAEASHCTTERYGSVIYLIPDLDNHVLGYSKKQLKDKLCKSNGTDRDYYLSQFAIITLLVAFYDGQGSSSKSRSFLRVGELLNLISQRLAEGVQLAQQGENDAGGTRDMGGLAFADMQQAFEALRSNDKGSRSRTTKEGFLYNILMFLEEQNLIEFVEKDEMIYTTEKLDHFMDWNLLNKNHYDRIMRVLRGEIDE